MFSGWAIQEALEVASVEAMVARVGFLVARARSKPWSLHWYWHLWYLDPNSWWLLVFLDEQNLRGALGGLRQRHCRQMAENMIKDHETRRKGVVGGNFRNNLAFFGP